MARNIPIKVARAQCDMTQKDLAQAVGVSRQTMNAIEQGVHTPTIKLCSAICKVLVLHCVNNSDLAPAIFAMSAPPKLAVVSTTPSLRGHTPDVDIRHFITVKYTTQD